MFVIQSRLWPRFFVLKIEKVYACTSYSSVVNFIDANLSTVVIKVIEHLLKQFNDLRVSRSTVVEQCLLMADIEIKDCNQIRRYSMICFSVKFSETIISCYFLVPLML
ncbi:hypothetical protein BCV71DRAFT_269767 [Rhizopus microsporus]|uniref:Uncharacterized protein n=1 Tax=Rhizopus microsporus TaxID=58291 RepID=A0A1X0SDN6_RHIZD|nr:hypothetical protein BCV71DRAFT_269767 [Rhizopus microsporus]